MKFIANADLVGLHASVKSFTGIGSFLHEITISLEQSLQALLDSDFRVSFFYQLFTAKGEGGFCDGVSQQIIFLSERYHRQRQKNDSYERLHGINLSWAGINAKANLLSLRLGFAKMRGQFQSLRFFFMATVVILIPARFASTRFPGKPLAKILGISMVERVFKNCAASGFPTFVVTDNAEIENHVLGFGGKVLRVDDDVPSGSERIALAYERFCIEMKPDLVINVQGDEPLLKGDVLKELADYHLKSHFEIATLVRERSADEVDFKNHNVVKAVWVKKSGECLYFSRESLPHDRDGLNKHSWFHHIGVYSYKPSALSRFVKLPMGKLENLEKLEQLRALENGMRIGAIVTHQKLIGVDVPDDIKKVEGALT